MLKAGTRLHTEKKAGSNVSMLNCDDCGDKIPENAGLREKNDY